jgi:hypothetical protein
MKTPSRYIATSICWMLVMVAADATLPVFQQRAPQCRRRRAYLI